MSQEELSRRSGLPASSISHYESGRRGPSIDNLVRIVRAMPGLNANWLLGITGDEVTDEYEDGYSDALHDAQEALTALGQRRSDPLLILNFTARLSDRGEGLGERPEPARERRGDPSPALPADDWVEWKGGENPAPGKVVDVKYRNGVADNYVNSTEVDWPHASSVIGITGYDIIAYRILPSTPSDTGKASG